MLWHSATVREGWQDLVYNSCGIYEVGVFSSFVLFGWGRWAGDGMLPLSGVVTSHRDSFLASVVVCLFVDMKGRWLCEMWLWMLSLDLVFRSDPLNSCKVA